MVSLLFHGCLLSTNLFKSSRMEFNLLIETNSGNKRGLPNREREKKTHAFMNFRFRLLVNIHFLKYNC